MKNNNLKIENLTKSFKIGSMLFGTTIVAVDHINLNIESNDPWIMAIVGESGSGKSTLAKMILKLMDCDKGEVKLGDNSLESYNKRKKEFRKMVQPIFQNPFTAFSSRRTVDSYLYDTAYNLCNAKGKDQAKEVITEVLKGVGLNLQNIEGKYPNQFSGGELQRISIARALMTRPKLIVADEPVAMIDASLRMNIVNLFKQLKKDYQVNFIYITHDLSTAYYVSDYIATMYRGNLIEFGEAKAVLNNPGHPYTELLQESIPVVGRKWDQDMKLPDMETKEYASTACKFASRCKYVMDVCRQQKPKLCRMEGNHMVLCQKYAVKTDDSDIIKK